MEPTPRIERVRATPAALQLLGQLQARHGALMLHLSGGCCDGSAPMCLSADELMVGTADVYLGDVGMVPFYMSVAQFTHWQHTQLLLDAEPGVGGVFSLERPTGLRFLVHSRLFTDAQRQGLAVPLSGAEHPPVGAAADA